MKCQTCGDTLTSLEFQCLTCNPFDNEDMFKDIIVSDDPKAGAPLSKEEKTASEEWFKKTLASRKTEPMFEDIIVTAEALREAAEADGLNTEGFTSTREPNESMISWWDTDHEGACHHHALSNKGERYLDGKSVDCPAMFASWSRNLHPEEVQEHYCTSNKYEETEGTALRRDLDTWFNLESMIKPKYIVPEDIKFGRRLDEEDQYLGSCQKETYAVTNPTSDLKLVEALDEVVEMFLELNEHEDKKLHATSAIEWLRRKYGYSN